MSRPAIIRVETIRFRGAARLDLVYHGDLGIVNVDHALAATLVLCALVKHGALGPGNERLTYPTFPHGKATENSCTQSLIWEGIC